MLESWDGTSCDEWAQSPFVEVWLQDSIYELAELQSSALSWLDHHSYMSQKYSDEEGHTRLFTAFVEKITHAKEI